MTVMETVTKEAVTKQSPKLSKRVETVPSHLSSDAVRDVSARFKSRLNATVDAEVWVVEDFEGG